ncbi:MAG: translocation/assembly module TamB [Bacteroidetes bacterium]|nr:translocation/assembly module TamB [Bacteroidota bacterium]
MRLQVIKNRVFYWLKKIFLYTFFILLSFFTFSFLALQFPEVQTYLIGRYLSGFSQVTGFPATVETMNLEWFDRLNLKNVKIADPEKNEMISVENLTVNFGLLSLLQKGNATIDGVDINGAYVHLKKIAESDTSADLNINLFIHKINEQYSSGSGGASSAKLTIAKIGLTKSQFIYNESDRDSIKNGFDYRHFHLNLDSGKVNQFQIIGDTIQFDLQSLYAQDRQTKFIIHKLNTYFRISQSSMEFLNVHLRAGQSIVTDSIRFTYQSMDDLSDFNDKVNIWAKLKNTKLYPADLALFTYGLPPLPKPVELSGTATGKVSRFSFSPMSIALGHTKIKGRLKMDGLPNINETFIDLKITDGIIEQPDIRFLLSESTYQALAPLGHTHARAEFTGFVNDFVTKGSLATQLGQIYSDLNLKINETDQTRSAYTGNLTLDNFKLGHYLNDTLHYQNVSLRGHISGKGLTRETSDFTLDGSVSLLGFRHYNYTGITTNARFARQLFNGDLSIDDPNLQFNAKAFIDFRKGQDVIKVKAHLDTVFVDRLGFMKEPLFVKSFFDVDTRGLQLDSLIGKIALHQTQVNYNGKMLFMDSIHLISSKENDHHLLQLRSSLANANLTGNYHYTLLLNDLKKFWLSYYSKFQSQPPVPRKETAEDTNRYTAQLNVTLNDIKPLVKLANLDLTIAPGAQLHATLNRQRFTDLHLDGKFDTIVYNKKRFNSNTISFDGHKHYDSATVRARATVRSGNQEFSDYFKSKDILAQASWVNNTVHFIFQGDQEGNNNTVRLASRLDISQDSLVFKMQPSVFKIFNEDWTFHEQNWVVKKGNEWQIHQFGITHQNEVVKVNGIISPNPEEVAVLTIENFNLDFFNSLLQEKISGIVNGKVEARDILQNPFIQNDFTIQNLTVDKFLMGDITGKNQWNREQKRFDLNFFLDRENKRTVEMTGHYDPESEIPLNVSAKLEGANIKIIEPFMRGIFSNMDGTLTGTYTITGTFLSPVVNGEGKIKNGALMVDYLQTKYFFNGALSFSPREIGLTDFLVTDELKNKAKLKGRLTHRNYNDMRLDLQATFEKFQVMNTTAKDNSLFYGQAYSTGALTMQGPLENLRISATARSDKGTRIFIPLNGSTDNSVAKKDFISFASFADTLKQKKDKAKPKVKNEPTGITMDLNLDITPDAYSEIIFDIRSGDIIRGYGNGNLKLQFDTKGEFSMFGDFTFDRGNYNFTLYDIINKEFVINKGSKISWAGDPYTAVLNINASYRQLVSFAPVVTTCAPCVTSVAMRRKYPAEVQLKIEGAMLSPQINFDIVANDLPNTVPTENGSEPLNQDFKAFKAKLDEQELKKQVFSLIVLRRFSPPDAFTTGGGSGLYSSVSELLSNQLSYWLTQVDQNLEVNFDLGNFDQEAFSTFQLRLSYSLLNGRLRVTRDGAIGNQYNRSDVSNMLGDWTVDYLLTPDGNLKIKMFNRTNVNQLTSSTFSGQTTISTGFSLMSTKSFNSWKELLSSVYQKRRKEVEQIKKEDDGTK